MDADRGRAFAWANVFAARSDTYRALLWAAELAEYHRTSGLVLPAPAAELVAQVQESVTAADLTIIRRYVRLQQESVAN